jgi:hypothetical protein
MKKIIYIVDNKFRDLWGVDNLLKLLKKKNISLVLCNKFNWKLCVKTFNPFAIITPNARFANRKFLEIIKFCKKIKIKTIIYPSEGLDYSTKYLKNEFPKYTLKNVDKFFLWTDLQAKIHKKFNLINKVTVTGSMRFSDKSNFDNDKKIKIIGIATTCRYTTSSISEINIPKLINSRINNTRQTLFLKHEIEFFETLSRILRYFEKSKYKFILKPHPFEKNYFYEKAFPKVEVESDSDVRKFLSRVDVLLNMESSVNISALRFKVPVINIQNLVNMTSEYKKIYKKYLPTKIGLEVKSLSNLNEILKNYSKKEIFLKNIKKGDLKLIDSIAPRLNSVDLMCQEILKLADNTTPKINYLSLIKYYTKEVYLMTFNKRTTLYRPFLSIDKKLLKKFSLKNYE